MPLFLRALLASLIMTGCAQNVTGHTTGNNRVSEDVVAALDTICLSSEGKRRGDDLNEAATMAGFVVGPDAGYTRGEIFVIPGAPGLQFCDLKILGQFDERDMLFESLHNWAISAPVNFYVIDEPSSFESGKDRGIRAVWGRDKERLAVYFYTSDRADNTRARIMFDAN